MTIFNYNPSQQTLLFGWLHAMMNENEKSPNRLFWCLQWMVGKLQSDLFAFIKKIKFICKKYIKPNRSGYAD